MASLPLSSSPSRALLPGERAQREPAQCASAVRCSSPSAHSSPLVSPRPVSRSAPPCAVSRITLAGTAAFRLPARHRSRNPPPCRAADGEAAGEGTGEGGAEASRVSLGTAVLPADCDLAALETMIVQWATSLTVDANLPLQSPLKVERVPGGVQLGVEVSAPEGARPVDILVTVEAPSAAAPPMFRALRCGPHSHITPVGEPALMASMLTALRKAVVLSTPRPPPPS